MMTDLQIQNAVAELDDFEVTHLEGDFYRYDRGKESYGPGAMYNYLNSLDAIAPVIRKRWKWFKLYGGLQWQIRFWKALPPQDCLLFNTPKAFCIALLKAEQEYIGE